MLTASEDVGFPHIAVEILNSSLHSLLEIEVPVPDQSKSIKA